MMRVMIFMVVSAIILLTGCNSGSGESQSSSTTVGGVAENTFEGAVEYLGSGEPKYNLYAGTVTDEFADASIDSWSYENGHFDFNIGGSSYELMAQTPDASSVMCANSEEGQHLHVILNKNPYSAEYSSSFDYDIPNGQHHLLVFLGKSYHESLKHPEAHIARLIDVEDGNITNEWNIPDPALFYSRPKGTYVGKDAKKILLDFYPLNIRLGEDAKVKVQINGEQYYLYEWKPYFIEGLPYGDNTIGIQLVDMNGEGIRGKINSEYRKFQLRRDPAEALN